MYEDRLRGKIIEEIYHAIDSDRQMCIGADIQNYLLKVLEDNMDYNKGLNDAWELVKKIYAIDDRSVVFDGHVFVEYILRAYTPQEALAKLKAYEERIEVGDVVTYAGDKGVVLDKRGSKIIVLSDDCWVSEWYECDVEKTDKHIDIKSFLEQIGE
jgi:hypothetical protein